MREAGPLFDEVEEEVVLPPEPRVMSVGELAARVKGTLEGDFGRVVVQGEISGGKLHSSGHFYCDIKDEQAVLAAVAWRSTVGRWAQGVPANGTLVVAHGKLTTYPQRSTYQLMLDRIEPAGLGLLMQQLEALRQKLGAEGLFEAGRKKDLPFLPRRIGIVTSPTGAVIADMLHRIADRCPREVVLWPVAVQGTAAAEQVAAAVRGFNRLQGAARPDVLIVARGGGSFEDLMPFNSEEVVRAIAASGIPVVSGVGHEPDVTLCDLAADVRAPTPSAAAEMVVPVREELLYGLQAARRRLVQDMRGQIDGARQRVGYCARLLPDPRRQVVQAGLRLGEMDERLRAAGPGLVRYAGEKLDALARVLAAHDPTAPLGRGFVYMTRADGSMVRRVNEPGGAVTVHFKDGTREADLR